MRKIKLYIASSIDGKIARKNGDIDWLPDPTAEDYGYEEFYGSVDTILMGYKTYEFCLKFGEWHYKDRNTYVFSRDTTRETNAYSKLVHTDIIVFSRELKQQKGKDIWLVGGGEIVAALHDAGLIDEYIIAYVPVVLGEGIELFPHIRQQVNLKLTRSKVFSNGLAMVYYEKQEPE